MIPVGAIQRTQDTSPDSAMDRIARVAVDLIGANGAMVTFVDDRTILIKSAQGGRWRDRAGERLPLSDSLCQFVVAGRAPFMTRDAHTDPRLGNNDFVRGGDARAYLGVPLMGDDGSPLGAVCVVDEDPREWTEAEIALLSDLSALATSELRRRTLETELARADRFLRAQIAVTKAIAFAETPERDVARALRALAAQMGWAVGALWLANDDGDELQLKELWHDGSIDPTKLKQLREFVFHPGEGIVGRAWRNGQEAWLPDVMQEPAFVRQDMFASLDLHTQVCIPIGHGADVLGVLELLDERRLPHDGRALDVLNSIGQQLYDHLSASGHGATLREVLTRVAPAERRADSQPADLGSAPELDTLTKREREVLRHLVVGRNNREIAHELGVGIDTVKAHVSGILRKLEVSSRSAAIVKAMQWAA